MLVQGVLQFKWQSYAAKIFNTEVGGCVTNGSFVRSSSDEGRTTNDEGRRGTHVRMTVGVGKTN
jgi:hypothetical protein